ncbi:hypothetical protein [Caulobacter sp. 17J80-11]|uniref:hypothetical protein n=1 Tax=Caulobacter sp. 17J80-11 TaxID=2763502 RepID=UPI00165352C8|nr:hypothetical protein [Caulobacter sp. 17J80-11]MBC6981351.1 hypothetical protein [Caulobacter sp. 17J80-11]
MKAKVYLGLALAALTLQACGRGEDKKAAPAAKAPAVQGEAAKTPPAAVPAVVLRMTCNEGGAPAAYELAGDRLTRDGKLISTSELTHLGETQEEEGMESGFARHRVAGHVLTRDIFWTTGGQAMDLVSTQVFDFDKQTLVENGKDTCHHAAGAKAG